MVEVILWLWGSKKKGAPLCFCVYFCFYFVRVIVFIRTVSLDLNPPREEPILWQPKQWDIWKSGIFFPSLCSQKSNRWVPPFTVFLYFLRDVGKRWPREQVDGLGVPQGPTEQRMTFEEKSMLLPKYAGMMNYIWKIICQDRWNFKRYFISYTDYRYSIISKWDS